MTFLCEKQIFDPKNMEYDILHATFGHDDEIQPILVRCYGNRLLVDNYLFTCCIYDISVCKTKILDPKIWKMIYYMPLVDMLLMRYSRLILMSAILDFWLNKCHL